MLGWNDLNGMLPLIGDGSGNGDCNEEIGDGSDCSDCDCNGGDCDANENEDNGDSDGKKVIDDDGVESRIGDRVMDDFGEDGCVAVNAVLDATDDKSDGECVDIGGEVTLIILPICLCVHVSETVSHHTITYCLKIPLLFLFFILLLF